MTAPCQRPCPLRRSRAKTGLRLPASATLRLRLAGRCPNSSFLFPPLALGLRLLLFLQPLGGALKKQNAALASPPFICRWQQSAPLQSSPLLPKGEPLAYRTAFCQTPKVYSDVKDSALLQRAAASEQASLSSCCESLYSRALHFTIIKALFVQRGPYRYASGSPSGGAGKAIRL